MRTYAHPQYVSTYRGALRRRHRRLCGRNESRGARDRSISRPSLPLASIRSDNTVLFCVCEFVFFFPPPQCVDTVPPGSNRSRSLTRHCCVRKRVYRERGTNGVGFTASSISAIRRKDRTGISLVINPSQDRLRKTVVSCAGTRMEQASSVDLT